MIPIRLPNGFGSAAKIGGDKRRRNPWRARVTDGWEFDEAKGKAVQKFITLGYYPSKKEALAALADYHKSPVARGSGALTFKDVYELWYEKEGQFLAPKNLSAYTNAYAKSETLHGMKMREIRTDDMQAVLDAVTTGKSSQEKYRVLWSKLFRFALERDLVQKDYSDFVKLNAHAKDADPRIPFTKEQIGVLWSKLDYLPGVDLILIMIYSGMRVGELLNIREEHLHLDERWIDLHGTKTKAARRAVPIHSKIMPLIERRAGGEFLCRTEDGAQLDYHRFLYKQWRPGLKTLGFEGLTPHSCRHTAISLMTDAGVDDRLIKKIVGHSSGDITGHYTHAYIESLVKAIEAVEV